MSKTKGIIYFEEVASEIEPEDIWTDYDPERVRAALKKSAGTLSDIDHEQLIADVHAAREQDSYGRPA